MGINTNLGKEQCHGASHLWRLDFLSFRVDAAWGSRALAHCFMARDVFDKKTKHDR
jgi:hypothetical protein